MRSIRNMEEADQAALTQATAFIEQVLGMVKSNSLPGPVVPDLLAKVVKICGKADVSFQELSEFCRSHQALSARLLSLVNSAAYSRGAPISVLESAITRLGLRETSSILHAVATRSYLVGKDPETRALMLSNLEQAYAVGLVAQEITKLANGSNPAEAYSIGLFHNIGFTFLLYTLSLMQDKGQKISLSVDVLQLIAAKRGAELNKIVCDKLALPEIVVNVLAFPPDPPPAVALLIGNIHRAMWFSTQLLALRDPTQLTLDAEGEILGVTKPVLEKLRDKSAVWLSLLSAYSSAK